MNEERRRYAEAEIATPSAAALGHGGGSAYRVLVFGIGCLLHAPQQLEGYCLLPLSRGLSYARMHSIVNQALSRYRFQVPFDQSTDQQHERATPTFLVEYWRVRAIHHEDALNHCRNHTDLVFDLLGLDRGQKPREFFCIAFGEQQGDVWQRFSIPWYRGNLVSDFNQASTGNRIATFTPRLERNPFVRLLVRSYAEATAEDDPGIAHLRAWTVLELLADRAIRAGLLITHLDGTPILNARGKPVDTKAARAKVYELIRQSGAFGAHYSAPIAGVQQAFVIPGNSGAQDPAARVVPLWDVVRAAYAIRNSVAHEGFFSPDVVDATDADQVLAADLILNTPIDPRRWVMDQAYSAINIELNRSVD